jgi:signal peptidase I
VDSELKPGASIERTQTQETMMAKTAKTLKRWWTEWIRSVLLIVLVVTSFRSAIADWNDVPSGSMKPTIYEGDRIVVNKLAYDLKVPFTTVRIASWDNPQRGDIIVCYSPADGKRLVKRVVGIPGDEVAMHGDRLVVNGKPIAYAPLEPGFVTGATPGADDKLLALEHLGGTPHAVMMPHGAHYGPPFTPVQIDRDEYFVMGDNRNESFDSRFFGTVDREQILGRATMVAASVDPERHYFPRWDRFLHRLR